MGVAVVILLTAGVLRLQQFLRDRKPVVRPYELAGRVFEVEVADTDGKREKGLGDRDAIARDHAMLFPMGEEKYWVFWMKGMRFPIDIIWLKDGKVVDIHHDVPVAASQSLADLATYSPIEAADTVFEVAAGVARELGVEPGDELCPGRCRAPEPTASATAP